MAKALLRQVLGTALQFMPTALRHKMIRKHISLRYDLGDDLIIKVAETTEELHGAFRVLHDAYVGRGVQTPQPHGLRVTKYHLLPHTTVFVMKKAGKVIGTLSQVMDSPLGLPLESDWSVDALREKSSRIAELSSLAIDKEYRGQPGCVPLFRFALDYARQHTKTDYWVMSTQAKSKDYYQALFFFEPLDNKVVEYEFVKGEPSVAQMLDLVALEAKMKKHFGHRPKRHNIHHYFNEADFSNHFRLPALKTSSALTHTMTAEKIAYFHGITGVVDEITHEESLNLVAQGENVAYSSLLASLNTQHGKPAIAAMYKAHPEKSSVTPFAFNPRKTVAQKGFFRGHSHAV